MKTFFNRKRIGAAAAVAVLVLGSVAPALAQVIRSGRVRAFAMAEWTVAAPSGPVLVEVIGDGDTDLDCYVFDRFGNLLGFDDDLTDYCIVPVINPGAGSLIVQIDNLGAVYNDYILSVD